MLEACDSLQKKRNPQPKAARTIVMKPFSLIFGSLISLARFLAFNAPYST